GNLIQSVEESYFSFPSWGDGEIFNQVIKETYTYPGEGITIITRTVLHDTYPANLVNGSTYRETTDYFHYYTDIPKNPSAIRNIPYNYGNKDYMLLKKDGYSDFKYDLDSKGNVILKTRLGVNNPDSIQ